MAKTKNTKVNVPHKLLHSRISYLYQAAAYLSVQREPSTTSSQHKAEVLSCTQVTSKTDASTELRSFSNSQLPCTHSLQRKLVSDLKDVSLKMQIRLSPAMKHTMCKRCDTLILDSTTCTTEVENKSRNGMKPWADVLVKRCSNCGCERRFPVSVDRQSRRPHRISKAAKGG